MRMAIDFNAFFVYLTFKQLFFSCFHYSHSLLGVVLSGLGSVEPGDPSHRAPVHNIEQFGAVVGTLPYRAPECLLGDSDFTFAIDAWALGCLGV